MIGKLCSLLDFSTTKETPLVISYASKPDSHRGRPRNSSEQQANEFKAILKIPEPQVQLRKCGHPYRISAQRTILQSNQHESSLFRRCGIHSLCTRPAKTFGTCLFAQYRLGILILAQKSQIPYRSRLWSIVSRICSFCFSVRLLYRTRPRFLWFKQFRQQLNSCCRVSIVVLV
jgi:hypothetical protein